MLNLHEAIQEELEHQYMTAKRPDDPQDQEEQEALLLSETYTAINVELAKYGAELPPISTMELGWVRDGEQLLRGIAGMEVILTKNRDDQTVVRFFSNDGRAFDVTRAEDVPVVVQAIAKAYLWKYENEVQHIKLRALRNLRPEFPQIDGFYGELLVRFHDNINPGMTLYGWHVSGKQVSVRVSDYIFMHQLQESPKFATAQHGDSQFVRFLDSTFYLADLSEKRGCLVRLDARELTRLTQAIGRYIGFHNRLCEWKEMVSGSEFTLQTVEGFDW